MTDADKEKQLAAAAAAELVQSGMIVGLGTGSTAKHLVKLLGEKVRAGLKIRGIPTSSATKAQAEAEGIPLVTFELIDRVDLTLDGADELDPELNLTKGGGGALLFEKIVASASDRLVIMCDASKPVAKLGAFPLPIEVVPFGWQLVAKRVRVLGGEPALRKNKDGSPFVTDAQHLILDCRFDSIERPAELAQKIDAIVGVVEHGLFVGMADRVLVGDGSNVRTLKRSAARA